MKKINLKIKDYVRGIKDSLRVNGFGFIRRTKKGSRGFAPPLGLSARRRVITHNFKILL